MFDWATFAPFGARCIPGHRGYAILPNGQVLSAMRGRLRTLKQRPTPKGYMVARMRSGWKSVHRLLALAFIGEPPPDKPETRHLDGRRDHNVFGNVVWGTRQENSDDIERHGRRPRNDQKWNAVFTNDDVALVKAAALRGARLTVLARHFGRPPRTIANILRGDNYRDVQPSSDEASVARLLTALPDLRHRRTYAGAGNPAAKLTESEVREIRKRFSSGEAKRALGRAYGVSPALIFSIVTRRVWAHVH
jgi:hypothetical protein